ncbi:hypothetical protein HON36_03260 [Candidatus Parcubacteria bacterium]|jgi:photosystem II stability/assembly factor-like uncharacterized protein|nr:hypothetical protein [Candidatus Parcubacteria bacterium]MBT7228240.1 hypothetical protein [Candidatus Parcubacteria bacterium]
MLKQKLNKFKVIALILVLPIFLSGCISIKSDKTAGNFGGFFRSNDKAVTWKHVTTMYTPGGEVTNFNASNILNISFDAQDPAAVYLGSQHDGIFYSYNYGNGWFRTLTGKGTINSVQVDPKDKCTLFAAAHTEIYKTTDCSRKWERLYFEPRAGVFITSLAIKGDNTNIVFAGNSIGDLLRSEDGGISWKVLHMFNNKILDIVVQNHYDDEVMYVVTASTGIHKSKNSGENWQNLLDLHVNAQEGTTEAGVRESYNFPDIVVNAENATLRDIRGSETVITFNQDFSVDDGIIYANRVGLFRLNEDNVWQQVRLLTRDRQETIYSVAVNPGNTNEIFYGSGNALYHSIDNGQNWTIDSLPTTHVARSLEFSSDNRFLYLGALRIEK